jgi:hypothetical protein
VLDDKFNEKVTICIPTDAIDGVMIYRDYVGHAVVMESASAQVSPASKTVLNRTFLVKTRCEPFPGAIILYRGEEHHLKAVRSCRSVTGELECYRCTS